MIKHIVQKGENLSKIAKQYNTTVKAIAELNNITDTNLIYIGQELLIPEPETKTVYPGIASIASKDDFKKFWDFFLEKLEGNEYGVAGLMGNIEAESNFYSNNLQNSGNKYLGMTDEEYTMAVDNGTYTNFVNDGKHGCGYGLAQWTYWSRKEQLYNYAQECKKSIGDYEMQMNFLWKELSRDFKKVVNNLKSAKSVREASDTVLLDFEQPANLSEDNQKARAKRGQKYYDMFAAPAIETVPETQPTINEPMPEQTSTIEVGTPVLLKEGAKTLKGNTIFFLLHWFKLHIKSIEVIDEKTVYTLGIFKDFVFLDFQTTEENFTTINL